MLPSNSRCSEGGVPERAESDLERVAPACNRVGSDLEGLAPACNRVGSDLERVAATHEHDTAILAPGLEHALARTDRPHLDGEVFAGYDR
jgi:hypothetical protein